MADLSDQIEQAAATPASAAVDGQSASARPISDLVLADQYLAAKAGVAKKHRGIRFSKILPSGPVSDQGGSNGPGSFSGGSGGLI